MSGSPSGKRGGTPSTTTPMAGPWLSPQVVKRNSVPNELPAIFVNLPTSSGSYEYHIGLARAIARRPLGAETLVKRLARRLHLRLGNALSPQPRYPGRAAAGGLCKH